jgi:hypothetical protein
MEIDAIKKELHQYIDNGDEKLLRMMLAIAKVYYRDDELEYDFTDDEIKELDERRRKWLSGESKTYTWEEAKEYITGKKKL